MLYALFPFSEYVSELKTIARINAETNYMRMQICSVYPTTVRPSVQRLRARELISSFHEKLTMRNSIHHHVGSACNFLVSIITLIVVVAVKNVITETW